MVHRRFVTERVSRGNKGRKKKKAEQLTFPKRGSVGWSAPSPSRGNSLRAPRFFVSVFFFFLASARLPPFYWQRARAIAELATCYKHWPPRRRQELDR